MVVTVIDDVFNAVQEQRDAPALHALLQSHLKDLGWGRFAYYVHRSPTRAPLKAGLINYPPEWLQRYKDRDYYNVDPVPVRVATELLPFEWDTARWGRQMNPTQRKFFGEASDFGISHGVTVPVHGPNGGLASLSLYCDPPEADSRKLFTAQRRRLHVLACCVHDSVLKRAPEQNLETATRLTQRERECLLWTARGKTTWEVSHILHISEHTALFHIKNTTHKLGVFSKHHAVVKAIMQGMIFP